MKFLKNFGSPKDFEINNLTIVQSYEIKSPPWWTIWWFRILGIVSVENIDRLGVMMFQTSDNSQLRIDSQYSSQQLTIVWSLIHHNTQPILIFSKVSVLHLDRLKLCHCSTHLLTFSFNKYNQKLSKIVLWPSEKFIESVWSDFLQAYRLHICLKRKRKRKKFWILKFVQYLLSISYCDCC
jgi:hypothetical protein